MNSKSIAYLPHEDKNNELLLASFDISKSNDIFGAHETPRQINEGGIFICQEGEGDFLLDLKNYKLKKGDMCVVFPFSIFQTRYKSDDFNGKGIIGTIELFQNIQVPSSLDYYLYIKENPCISLSEREQKMLLEICDRMTEKYTSFSHPFRMEVTYSLFRMLYYEIIAIYKKGKPIVQESLPRKDMLVRKFMFLLAKNYQKHRDVEYYACEICVTPRYLSSVVKEKTGAGASYWINDMVIMKAKTLLADSRLSVLQISDELNFPNPSFFGQYFKKYVGMTPKKFRDMEI